MIIEIEKWRDGTDMVCSICHNPILKSQPRYSTISHSPKKRDSYHYFCKGGTIIVVGSPQSGVIEVSEFSS